MPAAYGSGENASRNRSPRESAVAEHCTEQRKSSSRRQAIVDTPRTAQRPSPARHGERQEVEINAKPGRYVTRGVARSLSSPGAAFVAFAASEKRPARLLPQRATAQAAPLLPRRA